MSLCTAACAVPARDVALHRGVRGYEAVAGHGVLQQHARAIFGSRGTGGGASARQIEAKRDPSRERVAQANRRRSALHAVALVRIHRADAVHAVEQRDAEPRRRNPIGKAWRCHPAQPQTDFRPSIRTIFFICPSLEGNPILVTGALQTYYGWLT